MKAIKCELCGASELKKVGGEYVCQYCGTKYSLEEAQNLMVEIEGTVKIDSSSQVANLETLAKRAMKDGSYNQANGYYGRLLELDSNNWEYVYNKGVCEASLGDLRAIIKGCNNAFSIMNQKRLKIENPQNLYRMMAYKINELAYIKSQPVKNGFNSSTANRKSILDSWKILIDCIDVEEYAARLVKNNINNNEEDKRLYIAISKNIFYFCDELGKKRTYIKGRSGNTPLFTSINISTEVRNKYFPIYKYYKYILMKYDPNFIKYN